MEGEAHSYRKLLTLIMASVSIKRPRPCQNDIDDDLATSNFVFSGNDTFPRFLVIQSQDGSNPVTSLSPFVIEKQIESLIGTPKSVKKLKNKTLLVETNRKSQTDNLLKVTSFFNLKVSVSQHNSLNSSKGIIRDRMLKGESEDSIVEYLRPQGVTACKRFKIKKEGQSVETNTLLLTFDRVSVPKSLKIFYRVVPVDVYVPNPLRCFNCQRFGHHENNCTEDPGSVCENCGADGHAHQTSQCKNPTKCINCGKDHSPKSNICEVWLKEKAIMKLKVTNNISYLEAKKLHENKPETTFSKIVQSIARPEMKDASTQYKVKDYKINASTKVIEPKVKSTPKSQSGSQSSQSSSSSQDSSQSSSQPSSSAQSQPRSQSLLPQSGGGGQRSASRHSSERKKKDEKSSNKTNKPDTIKTQNRFNGLEDRMDTC